MTDVFTIRRPDRDSQARLGTLHLAHGTVQTPAFVPLATRGSVKTLAPADVEALGFEMVLGNTYHLFLSPGPELVDAYGGLGEFMRWPHPIITDSGGFQVFSMGYGSVADEIKGRGHAPGNKHPGAAPASLAAVLGISEEGVRFRSYLDGSERFLSPEESMRVQAALHSDIVLAFDECTPFHATREYTARSTERTHRWLERCLQWQDEHGSSDQVLYGIIQGGVEHDLRIASVQAIAASGVRGIAIGGSLGQDKPQMREVVGWTTGELDRIAPERPRHLLGIGDIDDLLVGVQQGIDTFDCAMPTRLARHGVAIVPEPDHRWRVDLAKSPWRGSREPILDGCPCPTCTQGFTRGYINYCVHAGEATGARLLTLHNLSFIARLMSDLRAAIEHDELAATVAAFFAGRAPAGARPLARDRN
jgi:queuine tRNA-ribosyltransferase